MSAEGPRRFAALLVELGFCSRTQVDQALAAGPHTAAALGEGLITAGALTRGQLQRALAAVIARADPFILERPPLGELLVGLEAITQATLDAALARQAETGQRLGEVLLSLGALALPELTQGLQLQERMADAGPRRTTSSEFPAVGQGGRKVLVVDDSPLALTLIAQGLSAQGFEVVCFEEPFAALERLEAEQPDLVLTDLEMPGLGGDALCQRLKAQPGRQVPVIILTANDGETRRVSGLRAGADDYVHKGASMEELAARIESVLRRTRETERVRRLFARYTSDAVVHEVLSRGELVLTGERREVTVLFADVRNFTALAESREPEAVVALLNEVLGALADAVLECGGTLDKFLGDGLMAVWGAPVWHPDDARAAATRMVAATRARNQEGLGPRIELGLGLNTGPVIAGSLGSARRTEYTCIGDVVNVAARLCALAGPSEILVGAATAAALAAPHALEPLPPVRVKGKLKPVELFRATDRLPEALARASRF